MYVAHNPSECYAVMNYVKMSQPIGVQVMGGASSFNTVENNLCPNAKGSSTSEVELNE